MFFTPLLTASAAARARVYSANLRKMCKIRKSHSEPAATKRETAFAVSMGYDVREQRYAVFFTYIQAALDGLLL